MYSTTKRIPKATRHEVYTRDGRACILCLDARVVQLHHVVPRGRGGSDAPQNLVCLCPACHRVAHGDYAYTNDFPFDCATAYDAMFFYLADCYGSGFSLYSCLRASR
jgi:hypothetical protein